jgi:hypothetical protein
MTKWLVEPIDYTSLSLLSGHGCRVYQSKVILKGMIALAEGGTEIWNSERGEREKKRKMDQKNK